jgi:LysM repeat protein
VAEGEQLASEGALPGERATGPFRAGPERDPGLPQSICRFLALTAGDGTFEPAVRLDTANRCVAIGEPVAQSGRQQELLCLAAAHVNCPRYLRGVLLAATPAPPPPRQPIAPAVIGATLVLATAIAASFGFLAVRGSFNLPVSSPAVVAVIASASPTPIPSPTVAASASPTPSSTEPPTPAPTPSPIATASPTPTPTPSPRSPTPTPTATSDRFALLTKCPSTADCWIYVIRAGDNLQSIANYFGVSYSRMLAMNPDLEIPIHPGDHLRIPTPTR